MNLNEHYRVISFPQAVRHARAEDSALVDQAVAELRALKDDTHAPPKLKAEIYFELGQTQKRNGFGAPEENLEESFSAFEAATLEYISSDNPLQAAYSAVAATQVLDWLAELSPEEEHREQSLQRLEEHGAATHQQILNSHLPKEETQKLLRLVKAACQKALSWKQILVLQAPSDEPKSELIKALYLEAAIHLCSLRALASAAPGVALACGVAGLKHIYDLVFALEKIFPRYHNKSRMRGTLKHYVSNFEVIPSFFTAFEALSKSRPSSEKQWGPGEQLNYPALTGYLLHQVLLALFQAAGTLEEALSIPQWESLSVLLEGARPLSMPTHTLLQIQNIEARALRGVIGGNLRGEPLLRYAEERLGTLEKHAANHLLSSSERMLLSGWSAIIIQAVRATTGDLQDHAPEEALRWIERFGAMAFRFDTRIFGRWEAAPRLGYQHPLPEPGALPQTENTPAEMWASYHLSRSQLDHWGRFKMMAEASRINPTVRKIFTPVLEGSTEQLSAFLSGETPEDVITSKTGIPREQWEKQGSWILVRSRPQGLAQFTQRTDQARREVAEILRALGADDEVRAALSAHPEQVDVTRAIDFLLEHPDLALVVPGPWPHEHSPINIFYAKEGQLRRGIISSPGDIKDQFVNTMRFRDALWDDRQSQSESTWKELDEAMKSMCDAYAPWAHCLSDELRRCEIKHVVFLLRGEHFPLLPWEDFFMAIGESNLKTSYLYSVSTTDNPFPKPTSQRQGVSQLYGAGVFSEPIEFGAQVERALSAAGIAEPPCSGEDVLDTKALHDRLRGTSRLRLFLHGYHSPRNPGANALTLVGAQDEEEEQTLSPSDIRALPLAGLEAAELWACEGTAYGRSVQEHGAGEEPEDLTTAFLLAGARRVIASRWQAPALPSALLMERFALLVHSGLGDVAALARARQDLCRSFAPCGPIEQELLAGLRHKLVMLADDEGALERQAREAIYEEQIGEAIQVQRRAWYSEQDLPAPDKVIRPHHSMQRMITYIPPRPERIVQELRSERREEWLGKLVEELLRPYRSPLCWAGFRVVIRTISDWKCFT